MSTTLPDDLDALDQQLFAAYEAFAEDHPVDLAPVLDLGPAVARHRHQAHRRHALVAAAACLVLVVLAAAVVRQRAVDPDVRVTPPASPTDVELPDTPLRWFGFDPAQTPELSLWSAYMMSMPRRQAASFVSELHAGGDWRAQPAASVVILDAPYAQILPTATDAPAPGGDIVRNGGLATMVAALDDRRTLRITAAGIDDDSIRTLAGQVPAVTGGQPWSSLPADLQVVQLRRDRITAAEAGALASIDRTPIDRQSSSNPVEIRFTADPVDVAEDAVRRSAGNWIRSSVAGVDGMTVVPSPAMLGSGEVAVWRDGARQYAARRSWPASALPTDVARLQQAIRELTPEERSSLVVGTAELIPSAPGYASMIGYQVPPGAQPRIDTFRASLPVGIVALGGDGPNEYGVGARGADPLSNNVVGLSMVPTTTAARTTGTEPWLVQDVGSSVTVAWLSPSGWSYQLTAYSKDRPQPPMNPEQLVALLRTIDASGS